MTGKKDQIITRVGSEDIRKALKKRAIDDGTTVQALVEGWINEYVSGGRIATHGALPTEGTCPLCESTLGITPDGLKMLKPGPVEPLTPGSVPDELVPLVLRFVNSYLSDPIFASTANGMIEIHRREKMADHHGH